MKNQNEMVHCYVLIGLLFIMLSLTGCTHSSGLCEKESYADLSEIESYIGDEHLPFQFPLENVLLDTIHYPTAFCASRGSTDSDRTYHAAEDYFQPAGTPVYAIADGKISFSGPMGGYGWLIIIDHPEANLYSLYGHLSPSRWYIKSGTVSKGELIAYLGNSDENGGSAQYPLVTHLHLGIRSGQRKDYPGKGEWRWQAGWIKPCPKDLGWLKPSEIITNQTIPSDEFRKPSSSFIAKWGIEFVFAAIYMFGGICMFIFATKRNKPIVIVISGIVLIVASGIFYRDGWSISNLIIVMAITFLIIGLYRIIRRSKNK